MTRGPRATISPTSPGGKSFAILVDNFHFDIRHWFTNGAEPLEFLLALCFSGSGDDVVFRTERGNS